MMKTETKKTLLRVHVFSKKARTRRLKSKSILVTRAVSSSSSSFQEEEDDYLEDEDEDNEYYSFDDDEDFERAQERERVGQRTSDRQRARLATGFGKGRKNASSTSSSSSLSSSRENEQKLAALIDGGEVFFLSTAVAMKARQVYVEQRARAENENASVASSSGGALMDLPLYLAVVVGAVLRRASTSASGSGMFSSVFASKSDKVKFPRAVNARVQNLEVGLERLDENQRRYSRDVSRLGTRVRLTRRELSPMIRRAEATSITFGEVAAELAKRIEVAEEEGSKLAETMASLHAVSAKQFEVLSKSVRELRAAMKELEMEAEEAAMMTSEEIASKKTNGIINSSRFAKKEELEKLERMLTEALEEMEDCLTTMVREKALALGEEIDDISLMKDDSDDVNDDEEREEEKNKELVWVGESSAQKKKSALLESQNTGKSADDDEKKIAAENEPPTIQLYKFDEFNSSSSSRSSNSSSSSTDDESGTRRDGGDVSK